MSLAASLMNGLNLGAIYGLIALGYTMVYGIAKMLNFAHGDIIMTGALTIVISVHQFGISPWLSILLSIGVCVSLGVLIEKIAYKPLRKASSLSVLITAIGVSFLLQNTAQLLFGSSLRSFPKAFQIPTYGIGGFELKGDRLMTILITALLMVGLVWIVYRSKVGLAMRAVAQDRDTAELMGIDANRVISMTFAIGSALASVAGLFYGIAYGFVGPYSGSMPGIKAFTAAVLGGIGSVPGAIVGGVLLGLIESFAKTYLSSELSDAIVFAVLIGILFLKPTGLMGQEIREKV